MLDIDRDAVETCEYFDTIQQSDLGLTAEQLELLQCNGFVCGESRNTYVDGLVDLYAADLPLFVTVDSILHAVHRSFEDILSLVEAEVLLPELAALLRTLWTQRWTPDLQVYLGVPLRLMAGVPMLDEAWVDARGRGELLDTQGLDVYISTQTVRYRQLYQKRLLLPLKPQGPKPRFGVCPESQVADADWLIGRHGFDAVPLTAHQIRKALAAFPTLAPMGPLRAPDPYSEERIVSIAHWILTPGGPMQRRLTLFGRTYELDWRTLQPHNSQRSVPPAYDQARAWFNAIPIFLAQCDDTPDEAGLAAAQWLSRQSAACCPRRLRAYSEALWAVAGPPDHVTVFDLAMWRGDFKELPRAPGGPVIFHLLGPGRGLDSEVLESLVATELVLPSGLDVASIVFGSEAAVRLAPNSISSLRAYVDALPADAWDESLYMGWLACLRTLSQPAEGAPPLCRSEAWARRMLNAQMTGWAELRHDTILYARESRTWGVVCEFPAAAIDPYPDFYAAVGRWAQKGQNLVRQLNDFVTARLALPPVMGYFHRLVRHAAMLEDMARRQLQAEPWTAEQEAFLRQTVTVRPPGSCAPLEADGWYPRLYFRANSGTLGWPTIATVQCVDVGDQTAHLQVATGHPSLFYTRMSIGGRQGLFVGLVGSYFERVASEPCSDTEWHTQLGRNPCAPDWRSGLGLQYRVQEMALVPEAPHLTVELFLAPDRPARHAIYHPQSYRLLVREGQVPCPDAMREVQQAYGLTPHPGRQLAWHVNFHAVVPPCVLEQARLYRPVMCPNTPVRLAPRNARCSLQELSEWYALGVRTITLHY